jgi:hypothetical protein
MFNCQAITVTKIGRLDGERKRKSNAGFEDSWPVLGIANMTPAENSSINVERENKCVTVF